MRNVTPCPNWRELLSAYHDNNLSPKDRKRVAAHLQSCDDCRRALAQMDGDRDRFIDAYMAPAAKVDVRESVLAELRADTASAKEPRKFIFWDWVFHNISAAVIVTLILILAVFMSRDPLIDEAREAWDESRQIATAKERPDTSDASALPKDWTYENRLQPDAKVFDAPTNSLNGDKDDYGMNAYINGTEKAGDSLGMPLGRINDPSQKDTYDTLITPTYSRHGGSNSLVVSNYQAIIDDDGLNSYTMSGRLNRPDSVLKMAYDIDYRLQVKNALQKSRQAQEIISGLGGFTMNYQYVQNEHEPAVAAFNGKIPAEKAEAALAEIEKLGNVRGLTIAGEDLTGQFQAQREEVARQTEHAKKLDAIGTRSASKVAAGVEDQRHAAKGQVNAAKNALTGLTTRHELVTISAAFYEAQPREPLTLARATAGTRRALNYALLLLVTIAVFFLVVAVVAAPFVGLRYWRRRRSVS